MQKLIKKRTTKQFSSEIKKLIFPEPIPSVTKPILQAAESGLETNPDFESSQHFEIKPLEASQVMDGSYGIYFLNTKSKPTSCDH